MPLYGYDGIRMQEYLPEAFYCKKEFIKSLNSFWDIYGKDMVPTTKSLVINPPSRNSEFDWHQDGYSSLFISIESEKNIEVYINDSNKLNGVVHIIPKKHSNEKIDFLIRS